MSRENGNSPRLPYRGKAVADKQNNTYREASPMRTEAMDVQCAASELAALGEFRQETFPRVGEFFADYSLLTPEEIAQTDLEGVELFKHSLPVSQTGESDLELAELFENSVPVSR